MKKLALLPLFAFLAACSHGNCHAQKKVEKKAPTSEVAMTQGNSTSRVKVFKYDGSLQCGQGAAVPVATMQKELKDIKVFSSKNQNDGMMRIQVCGSPTGNANVYEIDRKDLEAAVKLGFKEWLAD